MMYDRYVRMYVRYVQPKKLKHLAPGERVPSSSFLTHVPSIAALSPFLAFPRHILTDKNKSFQELPHRICLDQPNRYVRSWLPDADIGRRNRLSFLASTSLISDTPNAVLPIRNSLEVQNVD